MLEAVDIRAGYGRIPVLNGVSLAVATGEAIGILGHNGMGKTTLLKALMGYLPLTQGSVRFDGTDITRELTHRRSRLGLAYVPQGREIFPFLTVAENLQMAARDASNVDAILSDFPSLKPLLARQGGSLSGGQQQILAIARCMMVRPKCILLDEPTEGIQPSIIEEITDMLARLRAKRRLALVIVEQRLQFVADLADRVLVLQKGAILKEIAASALSNGTAFEEIVGMTG
jgi:branched-chain amino acid transport system ATP-binding protein